MLKMMSHSKPLPMLPFRSEIRNSPKEQTIKIYLSDISLDNDLQMLIEQIDGVRIVEVQKSVSRNRVPENITVFRKENTNINDLKKKIDKFLHNFFEEISI